MINRLVFVILVIASVYVSGVISECWFRICYKIGTPASDLVMAGGLSAFFIPLIIMILIAQWICFGKKGTQNA